MSADHTEKQSTEDLRQAKELSLRRTAPPAEVPGYELQKQLGSGAFGEVWVGTDQTTARRVAIKFYTHRGTVDWTLLSREVEKLAVLSADRYVVQLLDVGWDSDPPYYVMDYIKNGSLDDLLKREGALPLSEAVEIFAEVAVGLMHLHGKGVLHCDLKPANVLLDEDQKPRLADFGQSRLPHEQAPALGTLFYMAPEQADLEAVPDARWDVYALGALLYCMLTGEPPFHSQATVNTIDSLSTLQDRLACYRKTIESQPRPTKHRQIRGIDTRLSDIVDRCLAVHPRDRYPSVQSVYEALQAREEARLRNPLLILGLVGPIALLLVMAWFGWVGYERAMNQATNEVRKQTFINNMFAAQHIANTLESEIERYYEIAIDEANKPELHDYLSQVSRLELLDRLQDANLASDEAEQYRSQFLENKVRLSLKHYLENRLDYYLQQLRTYPHAPKLASMFVVGENGTILASVYNRPQFTTKSVGRNFAWRTYFHGGPVDLASDKRPPEVQHITGTQLSAAFQSTTTKTWKVAVSTPIYGRANHEKQFTGVFVLTTNTGDFDFLKQARVLDDDAETDRVAVLVDPRTGDDGGTILQHQLYTTESSDDPNAPSPDYSPYKVSHRLLEEISDVQQGWKVQYRDPLADAIWGEASRGEWIAALAEVHLPNRNLWKPAPQRDPDLIVLVQQKERAVTFPVRRLGTHLVNAGIQALIAIILTVCILWYIVVRMLGGLRRPSGQHLNDRPTTDSLHSMETVAAPNRSNE